MKRNIGIIAAVLVFGIIVTLKNAVFIVTEGQQALVTQFGKPIADPITQAGFYFKKPFVQDVRFIDKRILSWDGYPNQIPTKDKKFISVDTTARWRVVDALKFIQTVRNETGARSRLDTILDSTTRDVISNNNLVEAVRNTNAIIEKVEERRAEVARMLEQGEVLVDDEISGEIEPIEIGREQLSRLVVEAADKELTQFGIKLVDVQLRRISYEKSVEAKVYDRMISERQRVAQKIRSIGQGERAKIEGRMTRDLRTIESEGYRRAQQIRGAAEARAAAIFAQTLSKDPAFFEFSRSMEAYERTFTGQDRFILSSDSEFLRYFKQN
jgi:modulator of FtsH protease HflC